MKLLLATFLAWSASKSAAFAPPQAASVRPHSALSFGLEGGLLDIHDAVEQRKVDSEMKTYLRGLLQGGAADSAENDAEDVVEAAAESSKQLGDTVLVSGIVSSPIYDPLLLELLNSSSEDSPSNVKFSKIIALAEDVQQAKKRLISRQARYSGLLGKLEVLSSQSGAASALPSREQMEGVTSWILHLSQREAPAMLPQISLLAESCPSLKHVAIFMSGANDRSSADFFMEEAWLPSWKSLVADSEVGFTILATGEVYDGVEGTLPYHIGEFGAGTASVGSVGSVSGSRESAENEAVSSTSATEAAPMRLSKKEAYHMLVNCLASKEASNQAFVAYEHIAAKDSMDEKAQMEYDLIHSMRECGFSRSQEISVMLGSGVKGYKEYVENSKYRAIPTDESETRAKEEKHSDIDEEVILKLQSHITPSDPKLMEIQTIAKEWAVRSYWQKTMSGEHDGLPRTEKEYVSLVWDEALVEGKKTYDKVHSTEYERMRKKRMVLDEEREWKEKEMKRVMFERVKNKFYDSLMMDMDL